jgi:hypothetical protein
MQDIKIHQQKPQHKDNNHDNPTRNHKPQKRIPLFLHRQIHSRCQIQPQINTSTRNHNNKRFIISGPHTIINPHTMMIKILHTTITLPTMFGIHCYTRLAVLTK